MREVKGGITVFMSLVIVMILTLIFSLIEVVHLYGTAREADVLITAGAESIMADYNRRLWSDYGLLAVDFGYGDIGIKTEKAEERCLPYLDGRGGVSFIGVTTGQPTIMGYRLLSDQDGMVMMKEAVIQETLELPEQLISDWRDLCTAGEAAISSAEDIDALLEQGEAADSAADEMWAAQQKAAAEAAAAAAAAAAESGDSVGESASGSAAEYTPAPRPGSDVENPVKVVKEWKKNTVLKQVLPDEIEVSAGGISDINRPSERGLESGTITEPLTMTVTDRVLYGAYLKNHFSSFVNQMGHSGAKYEWEYVICGEDTDGKNLEEIAALLLAFREAENLASIYMDQTKVDEAETVALAIVGWTLNDGIIKAMKTAVIAAWAYMESVLDVRLLLAGGKCALLKSSSEWTSGLTNIGICLDTHTKAKEAEVGFSYGDYLLLMSFVHSSSETGLRSLDVIEDALHQSTDYAYCYVDQMVCETDIECGFSAEPIFLSLTPTLAGSVSGYEFNRQKQISYLTPLL